MHSDVAEIDAVRHLRAVSRILEQSAGTPRVDISERDERAAYWAVRVNSGSMSQQEEADLDAWTRADDCNLGAFARAMAANAYLDRAAAIGLSCSPESMPDADASDIKALDEHRLNASEKGGVSRRAWIGGGLGAAAAAIVAGFGIRHWWHNQSIVAPMGNVQRTALRDGSAVTLNSSAEIEVAFQDSVRQVSLLTGEVNFDVAKDAARPFIVDAGPIKIRVLGTSFLVRMTEPDTVSVTVREGRVEVLHGDAQAIRLVAGDHVSFANQRLKQERLTMEDVDRMGLWQRGELDLTGMTLADAAREFARYSETRIIIDEPAIENLKVAGIFSTSDPAGFARAAALAQGLHVVVTPEKITLSK